jgi:DNA-binding transcriptional ArsR family regulator
MGEVLFAVDSVEARRRIVEFLRERGGASVYQIAKALGISYGAAQWHIYVLEREGVVFSVVQGRRRISFVIFGGFCGLGGFLASRSFWMWWILWGRGTWRRLLSLLLSICITGGRVRRREREAAGRQVYKLFFVCSS